MAKHIDPEAMEFQKGTGLTGPGEPEFLHNTTPQELKDKELLAEEPPVPEGPPKDEDSGDGEEKELDVPLPAELDKNASAEEIVKAWALRLHDVYNDCATEDMAGYDFRPTFKPSAAGLPPQQIVPPRHGAGADLLKKIHNGHGITGREIKPTRGKNSRKDLKDVRRKRSRALILTGRRN